MYSLLSRILQHHTHILFIYLTLHSFYLFDISDLLYLELHHRNSFHGNGMKAAPGQSLKEVIRETIKGLNQFFLKALIICNGNFTLLPESYWTEMTTRCPSEYRDDRPKPLGKWSNWGYFRPENQDVDYKRGYRYSLEKWEDIVKQLRLNSMTDDNIDCSRLIPFLGKFTNNARDCGCRSEDILPLEYIGKTQNIIRRNSDWRKCLTKHSNFHGMLEYFIKYIGELPHHVHVVGCFNNDRQSLNGESFIATICEGSDSEGFPRIDFSSEDGSAFNVAPCGHNGIFYGLKRGNTAAVKQKFEKQVQDWNKQKHLKWGAISKNTKYWIKYIRVRNNGRLNPDPLTEINPLTTAEYQLLLKLNFPFNPKLEFWNSEFKRLLEFQAENGAKSLPCSTKGNKHRNLYQWCTRQRLEARKNKLSAEQLVRLKSVLDW